MSPPAVVIHRDADELAASVAGRLITRIADVQSARENACIVLTGGGVAGATMAAVAASPARSAVDWKHLDVWWGDERFLPRGHPERNETQARSALLDAVPVASHRVHPMPATEDAGDDPDAAAERYAAELAAASRPENHALVPEFDVLMLGVGPDGHVASLFPDQPALYETRQVVAVRGSPKPPPTRISLTLPAIRTAAEVWLVVAGDDKAAAVRMALSGAGEVQVPAAGARGRQRTLWLLDRAAASALPPGLERIASP
ncbi:MAG TPA: 6-phosphogluconolactonase [Jiangellaceae bacterium]|nr:6-phosphogluconolactonase [Jiangellaceae bacterium]